MGGVAPGSPVSAANTNSGFIEKNADDTTIGVLGLANTTTPSSTAVTNTQGELNGINAFVGRSTNAGYNSVPSWTNNDVGTNTDSVKERADVLTALFNQSTGHRHSGNIGDAPPIPFASILNVAQALNVTLPNNTAVPAVAIEVTAADVAGFIFFFTIKRGSGNVSSGMLMFGYNDADHSFSNDPVITEWGNTGVSMQADYNNGVTPTHRVLFTTTNTGTDATLNGFLLRLPSA